jgi:hypothetical protein
MASGHPPSSGTPSPPIRRGYSDIVNSDEKLTTSLVVVVVAVLVVLAFFFRRFFFFFFFLFVVVGSWAVEFVVVVVSSLWFGFEFVGFELVVVVMVGNVGCVVEDSFTSMGGSRSLMDSFFDTEATVTVSL